jgi:PAS domain-containing protein
MRSIRRRGDKIQPHVKSTDAKVSETPGTAFAPSGLHASNGLQLSRSELADFLGVSVVRVHQILKELRSALGPRAARQEKIAVSLLASTRSLEERLRRCKLLVEASPEPLVATDSRDRILAMNHGAERLLLKTTGATIGKSFSDLVVTGPPLAMRRHEAGSEQVNVTRETLWPAEERNTISFSRRQRDRDKSVPIPDTITQHAERECVELGRLYGGVTWHWHARTEKYDAMGGGTQRVAHRVVPLEVDKLRLHFLSRPRLSAEISEHTADVQFLTLTEARDRCRALMQEYASRLASDLLAETTTVFLFNGPLSDPPADEVPSRTLFPIGSFGFPESITKREVFHEKGGTIEGLATDVANSGQPIAVDFRKQTEYQQRVRRPNFSTFAVNSRFHELANTVMVPFALGPVGGGSASEVVGVVRLLNCYGIEGDGKPRLATAAELSEVREEVERIGPRLGLLYARVLEAARRDVIEQLVERLTDGASIEELGDLLLAQLAGLRDFAAVVIWRNHQTEGYPREFKSWGAARWNKESPGKDSFPAQACRSGSTIDIAAMRTVRRSGVAKVFPPVESGFEVPIKTRNGDVWGSVGFYSHWARQGGPYSRELYGWTQILSGLLGLSIRE